MAEEGADTGQPKIPNVFFLEGEITTQTLWHVLKFLLESPGDEVIIYMDSHGGCLGSAYGIYHALKSCGKRVVTHAVDEVQSAAVIIYLAGTHRTAVPGADFMLHAPYHVPDESVRNTATYLATRATELEKSATDLFSMYVKETKLKMKILKDKLKNNEDWHVTVKDCMKFGIIHKVEFPFPQKTGSVQTLRPARPQLGAVAKRRK